MSIQIHSSRDLMRVSSWVDTRSLPHRGDTRSGLHLVSTLDFRQHCETRWGFWHFARAYDNKDTVQKMLLCFSSQILEEGRCHQHFWVYWYSRFPPGKWPAPQCKSESGIQWKLMFEWCWNILCHNTFFNLSHKRTWSSGHHRKSEVWNQSGSISCKHIVKFALCGKLLKKKTLLSNFTLLLKAL